MSELRYPGVFIHPMALVEAESIGPGTKIWAFCNVLPGARLGRDCQICDRVFIEGAVVLGDRVTVKWGVSICDGITLEDGVFIGSGAQFTNDPIPRSKRHLKEYPRTVVGRFASLGAGVVVLPGIRIGAYAMVGAGAIVTRDVPDFAIIVGNAARQRGWACVCGSPLRPDQTDVACRRDCGRRYRLGPRGPILEAGGLDPGSDPIDV